MPTATRLLTLDRDQCMLLTDRTKNDDYGVEEQRVIPCVLLLKLGSLYLEIVQEDSVKREGSIAITEGEAWLLRSKVTSSDKTAADPLFGVKLLRKLYAILVSFDSEVPFVVGTSEEPAMDSATRAALTAHLEDSNAGH